MVSPPVEPPNDQPVFAVNVVDLLVVTAYQPVDTFAVQFVLVTVYLPYPGVLEYVLPGDVKLAALVVVPALSKA